MARSMHMEDKLPVGLFFTRRFYGFPLLDLDASFAGGPAKLLSCYA